MVAVDLRAFDGAIFDLDGVVTDTATVHAAAWKEVFDLVLRERAPAEPRFSLEDYRRHVDGRPRYDGAAAFLASRAIELPGGSPSDPPGTGTIHAIGNNKDAVFLARLAANGVDVFASSVWFARRLVAAGRHIGVVTASRHGTAVLDAAGLGRLFDTVVDGVVAEAAQLPGKPDPATFLAAASALRCDPARAIVIEDAIAGVTAASRGGFGMVVGVDRVGHGDRLRDAGADIVVGDLCELLVDDDDAWVITGAGGDHSRDRAPDALFALSDGHVGVLGDIDHPSDGRSWLSLVGGAYGRAADGLVRLLPAPSAATITSTPGAPSAPCRRVLQLRTGVLLHEECASAPASLRFVSLARPGVVAVHAASVAPTAWNDVPLQVPELGASARLAADFRYEEEHAGPGWRARTVGDRRAISVDARQATTERTLDRLYAFDRPDAADELDAAESAGCDQLLAEQRREWLARWDRADIEIDGDATAQRAVRFALFHLLASARPGGEAAVGARGLTGLGYSGHVFWDTDVYVLPALAAIAPDAARAVLEYRVHRLDAARAAARRSGLVGARFPWESADTGDDVTPASVVDTNGQTVPIRTGTHEVHIQADVAWAADHYLAWTADESFAPAHEPLLVETARWWAARISREDGRAHLRGVMGPDEYHEIVDDNAFTNGMARWNLRAAAALRAPGDPEARRWRRLAADLVDGYRGDGLGHEQFAGFDGLEPLRIEDIAAVPVAADVLLGAARVAGAQVIKQPDVLMLHHLLPDDLRSGSLDDDLDFYLPRTAHGSSLSLGICASLLARAGRSEEALRLFDMACAIDLDDITGTAAAGLHLGSLGSVWQAVVRGFGGVRPGAGCLRIDPRLPDRWSQVVVRLTYRGALLRVAMSNEEVVVASDQEVPMEVCGVPLSGAGRVVRQRDEWRCVP